MKIAFLTTHLDVFGSVRELIENANVMVDLGHEVTIYNDTDKKCHWLKCTANIVKMPLVYDIPESDVLILMDSPYNMLFVLFEKAKAKFKTMIMMGFNPDDFLQGKLTQTEKNLKYITENYTICADGWWQIDHFESLGLKRGHSIGGINLDQFKNLDRKRNIDIGYSGDIRPRKGTETLIQAMSGLNYITDYYWKKGNQDYLVSFLNDCTLFIDNHLRAGWCNPVLEAMACGCVVICNDIGAVRDFAIDGKTAIVLRKNTPENFQAAIEVICVRDELSILQTNALEKVKEFDYKVTVPKFVEFLKEQL